MARYEYSLEPDVSSIPGLLEWIEATCSAERLSADFTFKVALALEEAAMNVITHAFGGMPAPHLVRVSLDIDAERLAAEIFDNGPAFDPSAQPVPDISLPLEDRDPGGLGIHLMRVMMDRVEYRRTDGGNHLRLERTRPTAD